MTTRCFKLRFLSGDVAKLGLKRCHGGSKVNGILWKPCKYLERCLGMTVKEWMEKKRLSHV